MKIPEIYWGILGGALGGLVILFAPLPFFAPAQVPQPATNLIDYIKQIKFYIVSSGSMEPSIKLGSAILVMPKDNYLPNDVITFKSGGDKKNVVTHRIMVKSLGDKIYTTAGDANEDFDRGQVKEADILGSVVFSLPYIGYLINFAKLPYGFLLLVIIPATIIIYEELKVVKKELLKHIKFRPVLSGFAQNEQVLSSFAQNEQVLSSFAQNEQVLSSFAQNKSPFHKAFSILPVLGACLVFAAVTSSFFLDSEESLNNIFSAAATFPTSTPSPSPTPTPPPIAQTLVINEVLPDTSCSQGNTEAQWLEIYNGYSTTVDLKDFELTDGSTTIDLVTAANTNVSPGGLILIAHNSAIWNSCFSDNGVDTANFGGTFDIDTGTLQLKDPDGVVIDTVKWGAGTDDGGNPLDTPLQNESIERDPDGLDSASVGTAFNESDFVERTTPQPGL